MYLKSRIIHLLLLTFIGIINGQEVIIEQAGADDFAVNTIDGESTLDDLKQELMNERGFDETGLSKLDFIVSATEEHINDDTFETYGIIGIGERIRLEAKPKFTARHRLESKYGDDYEIQCIEIIQSIDVTDIDKDCVIADLDGVKAAFVHAANEVNMNTIQLLVNAGIDVNCEDSRQNTALIYAVFNKHTNLVELLVNAGADVNFINSDQRTALLYAANMAHKPIIQLLLNAGADVNFKDKNQVTALMNAAQWADNSIVELLLNAGADANIQDNKQRTALMYAMSHSPSHGAIGRGIDNIQVLLNSGADVNVQDIDEQTALMLAVNEDSIDIVQALLNAGADVNVPDDIQQTALMMALHNEGARKTMIQLLLNAGADVNLTDYQQQTALMIAASWVEDGDIVQLLLDAGADINMRNVYGDSAMEQAIEAREPTSPIVSMLSNAMKTKTKSARRLLNIL